MQYVRSISGSVSKTWNSINPATLSGAIDVIVVEQQDGSLACSPFHVRFGKFSLLRPFEKKVEFSVNNVKQNYAMKLGEEGEAFFVFETSDNIPEDLQTSPLVSPASSPPLQAEHSTASALQEPEFLDLSTENGRLIPGKSLRPGPTVLYSSSAPRGLNTTGAFTPLSTSPDFRDRRPESGDWSGILLERQSSNELHHTKPHSEGNLQIRERQTRSLTPSASPDQRPFMPSTERSISPPPLPTKEAIQRAMVLSKQLSASNIPSQVTDTGDLMLDMTGYKSSDDDAFRAEVIARKILSEELESNYDIGALIGADEHGNLWIYSSEEAKEAATQRAVLAGIQPGMPPSPLLTSDAASDPGYHSEGESEIATTPIIPSHRRSESDQGGLTPPHTPPDSSASGDPNRNYAKTLRLTSDQLKALGLKAGPNTMSFTVNRATCQAYMYLWKYDVPVVVSDIDGTITKSDALGHVLNMIGRDWTHIGVAKLYTEIVANGYNIMYLTSRSVGQADTTRAYLNGVVQEGYRLPKGPTIMSPDRTIAALRREIYLRKPEVFKMACLRDIKNLFGSGRTPFYAGFGNRLTDALSYRSVSIPSNRIFTINSNAEVSLDLLSLNKLKLSYVNMREVVDYYFPPVNMLVEGGGEEFTDFTYWRDNPPDLKDFSDSDNDGDDGEDEEGGREDNASDDGGEEDEYDEEGVGEMGDSYISRDSIDENGESHLSGSASDEDEEEDPLANSMFELDDRQEQAPSSGSKNSEGERQSLPNSNSKSMLSEEKFVDTEAEIISGMHGISLIEGASKPGVGRSGDCNINVLDKGCGVLDDRFLGKSPQSSRYPTSISLGGPSVRLKSSPSQINIHVLPDNLPHHVDLMDFQSDLDNNEEANVVGAQLRATLQEDISRAMRSRSPLLTHLNADTTWLLSIPAPNASLEPDRECVTGSKKHRSGDGSREDKTYFHILIDPWLRGSQSDVAQVFSEQWHASESAVQTIEEVEKRIWDIEKLTPFPINFPSPAGSVESESRIRSAIDAVLVSHEFSDHMHKETLLEVSSSVPVFAASKAAGTIRSWRYFDTVITLPAMGSNNKDWRHTSLSPLPPWLGFSRLGVDKTDLLYYHSAVMVAFSSHADANDIQEGGEGEASSAQAVIYTPHGITPSDLNVIATSAPPIHVLALLHGLHDINLRAAQLNLGAHNGLKLQRMTRAKYWIGTHDEVKRGRGIVSWFLKRKVLSVKEALQRELEERGEKSDEGVLDDVTFVELGNGESLLLE